MTATNVAIEVTGLTESFGEHVVLDGVDLTVPEGTVYCTPRTQRCRQDNHRQHPLHAADPGDGDIRVAGFDVGREPAGVRAAIGVTGQFSAVDELLTGRENLRLMADLAHLDRATAATAVTVILGRFDLVDAPERRAQTYSGGMKRRLDLAMTLIARPRLIFLDETTAGLDPRSLAPCGRSCASWSRRARLRS